MLTQLNWLDDLKADAAKFQAAGAADFHKAATTISKDW
jgi:hypothetical protein